MASSVARMPMEHANWGEGGTAASFRRELKEIVKDRVSRACVVFSCGGSRRGFCEESDGVQHSPPASPCSTCSDASSVAIETLDSLSACSRGRRNSRVLDRWAGPQAREPFATVNRKTHEAERSASSWTAESVSSRTAAFLHRDGSPVTGSPTSGTSSGDRAVLDDLPSNVRASSLIQMWRELEADAGQVHSPPSGGVSRGENLVPLSKGDFSSGEESCGRTEACDGSKWEPEHIGPNKSSGGSSDGAKELSLDIVKTHSSEFEIRNYPANCCENKEYLAHEEFADGAFLRGTIHHFMGWKKIDNLLARMRQERQSELNKLKLNYHVSRFSHRSWIQALLRFRHADRLLRIAHQQFRDSTDLELDSLRQRGSTIWFLREKFSPRNQHTINADQVVGGSDVPIILRGKSSHMGDKSTIASKGDQEATATRDFKSMLKKENTPHSTGEGPQENIQSSALSQQKGILEITNISCERATDSSNLDNEVEHLAKENFEHASLNSVDGCDGTWTSDGSQGKIEWQCQGRSVSPHLNKSYPETTEIHELLLRKPVSTSLTSNFRKTMDRLVLSLLQKQQSMCQAYEDEELLPSQRINGEFIDADEVTSSLSIMPLSFQKFHRPEDHQESCITSQPSHQFHDPMLRSCQDVELIHDLRSDVAEIHQEIVELRILLKNCVDEHSKLKSLIRDEVSSMCLSSVGISMALQASRWAPAKRGHCCICHQVPIDTLLYRCGHMCSCYRCAQELRWGAGICPVCSAPIDDIVKTFLEGGDAE